MTLGSQRNSQCRSKLNLSGMEVGSGYAGLHRSMISQGSLETAAGVRPVTGSWADLAERRTLIHHCSSEKKHLRSQGATRVWTKCTINSAYFSMILSLA